jgi:hypothetical protein
VLGVGGVGQVAGRLFYVRLANATAAWSRARVVLGVVAVTTVALAEVHRPLVVVATLSFLGGTARGVFTLVQATAVSDRWGPHGYGARNGILSGATLAAAAFAPWAGALMAVVLGGYGPAYWCLAAAAAAAALLVRPPGGAGRISAGRDTSGGGRDAPAPRPGPRAAGDRGPAWRRGVLPRRTAPGRG